MNATPSAISAVRRSRYGEKFSRQARVRASALAALSMLVVFALLPSDVAAQHGFGGGIHPGAGMSGFGGGMPGGFGGAGMMHPLSPAMNMGGNPAMHAYGFGPTHAYGYGFGGATPYGYHSGYGPSPGMQPLSPAGLAPYNTAGTHPLNPWGPINPAGGNHPLTPLTPPNNHPLTPLYPPYHPLTPLYPANNYVWPWWWYNYPSYGYPYQNPMYPFSNFWEMLGFYGHYGYYGPQQGMVVSGVNNGTLANQLGLVAGDVITAVNGEPVQNADQFVKALRDAQGTVSLSVYDTRTGRTSNMSFTPQDAARYAPAGSSGNTPATESQGTREDYINDESLPSQAQPQPQSSQGTQEDYINDEAGAGGSAQP